MLGGYTGQILWVDLSRAKTWIEFPDEKFYRSFIGGYGIGARILYSRQPGRISALGPENILGIVTGPLTGTAACFGCRFTAVAKSPLTDGWGDANCGGFFGPHLKFSGFDAIFFKGIAPGPVYLLVDEGQVQILEANHLWGQSTYFTEDDLMSRYPGSHVLSIGPAGEKLSLISCLITDKGSAAGRSGLGAVMGSKKLKAIAVRGTRKPPVVDPGTAGNLRQAHIKGIKREILNELHVFGTTSHTAASVHSGDSPVRNWGGVGVRDLKEVSGLEREPLEKKVTARSGCWHCPIACRGKLKAGTQGYNYPLDTRRPEYETSAAFGSMCLNNNMDAISLANHICNSNGLDTISTGTTIAFAMECFEHGLITRADTEGIDLRWGDAQAMVNLAQKIARREGFGDILADGVKKAAQRIGRRTEEYAVHIGGQELGLHDPKFDFPAFQGKPTAARFQMDATPGRHTSGFGPSQFKDYVVNAAGLCLHSDLAAEDPEFYLVEYFKAIVGWDYSVEELRHTGERIENMRHVFTLREGDNPLLRKVHPRIIGRPPFEEGPLAGVSPDIEGQIAVNLKALDWDPVTARPSRRKLIELGLEDVMADLWDQPTG
jgi:aldehyde:ferredoxin oxidoreductase